jgi:DnaJ-class molecular chaperone
MDGIILVNKGRRPTACCSSCMTPSFAQPTADMGFVSCKAGTCGGRLIPATQPNDWAPCSQCHGEGGQDISERGIRVYCPACNGTGYKFVRWERTTGQAV